MEENNADIDIQKQTTEKKQDSTGNEICLMYQKLKISAVVSALLNANKTIKFNNLYFFDYFS